MTTGNWTMEDIASMQGAPVYASDGDKVGKVEEIWYEEKTKAAKWLGLGTGIFRMKYVFVPASGAERYEDGLRVPYTKDQIKDAPDVDDGMTPESERILYDYYGQTYFESGDPRTRAASPEWSSSVRETWPETCS